MYKRDNYSRGGHYKYRLTIHLVLVSKFRYKIFDKRHGLIIKSIIQDICNHCDWNLQVEDADKDHIHLLLDYKPYESASNIVHRIKQVSTYKMWQDYPDLRDI